MERPRTSPKDFFLHLLNIIMLYITAVGFGTILFQVINLAFPDAIDYYNYGAQNAIRWSIASLIVAFPVYLLGIKSLQKEYTREPEKKNLRIKQWLEYFTLFGSAVIILVTFMTVIFRFLGGEITTRFILKSVTMLYIAGIIFSYYQTVVTDKRVERRQLVRGLEIAAIVSVIAAIVVGFFNVGSPMQERMRRFDEIRVQNLESIRYEATYYWQKHNGTLPENLDVLASQTFGSIPVDPETGEQYDYMILNASTFELCAVFNLDKVPEPQARPVIPRESDVYSQDYKAGHSCFTITITPELYPLIKE